MGYQYPAQKGLEKALSFRPITKRSVGPGQKSNRVPVPVVAMAVRKMKKIKKGKKKGKDSKMKRQREYNF